MNIITTEITEGEKGFSLIELLVVIATLSALLGITLTSFWIYKEEAAYRVAEQTLRNARTAFELGDSEVPDGFAFGATQNAGGSVSGDLAEIMPGMNVPNNVILEATYNNCVDGSGPMDLNGLLTVYPCLANKYTQWTRFCGGLEILQTELPGGCP